MLDYSSIHEEHELNVYPSRGITLVKGANARVWDSDGREYIDCVGGHGVAVIGHCNEKIVAALNEQARKLISCPGIFYNDSRASLIQKLIDITPANLTKAFISNSGTESIEAAIKFARIATGKTDLICAMKGFHGRTMGALSATFKPQYKEGFQPLVPGFTHVPFNDFEKLEAAVTSATAGIILEVVQGEGGINIGKREYFEQIRDLCDRKGILLIIDEVQTGFCRTGKMFACNHYDLEPDILCLAKAMAGGIPIGAVICSDKVKVATGKHGSTFGGNPLASACGVAAIDFMIEHKLDEQASEKGRYLATRLNQHQLPKIREIRQIGLMIGIELKEKVKSFIEKLMKDGVLVLPAGTTVIRLLPPLTISYDELDIVADKLIEAIRD